jgi:two-component system chemotaxis response regulator CheB
MHQFGVLALGSSTGGITATTSILSQFPDRFPVPIFVAIHHNYHEKCFLIDILQKKCKLTVKLASDDEIVQPSIVYVAPPGKNMCVNNGKTHIVPIALKQTILPSIDILFKSIASEYKDGAIGVILTGGADDGMLGIMAIKRGGGNYNSSG